MNEDLQAEILNDSVLSEKLKKTWSNPLGSSTFSGCLLTVQFGVTDVLNNKGMQWIFTY